MFFIWLALISLSLVWLPFTTIYEPPNIHHHSLYWFSYVCIALAIICLTFSKKSINIEFNRKFLFLLIPLIVFILLIPFPYNISAIILIIGIAVKFISGGFRKVKNTLRSRNKISSSFVICGIVLAIQTMVLPFFYIFASRYHKIEFAYPVLSFILNIFSANVSYDSAYLYIQHSDKYYSFIPSWDGFGLLPILMILVGGYCLFFLFSSKKRYYLILPVVLFLYMFIRYIILIDLYLEIDQAKIFWNLEYTVLSLFPLFFILSLILKNVFNTKPSILISTSTLIFKRKYLLLSFSLAISIICWIVFFGFVDPGVKKAGRILIDEKHSDWEWTTEEFNTTWYGERSSYNYYSMAEYLKYFYKVDQKREELTGELLKNYDILFIKTPTEPFTEKEIIAIRGFVDGGGSLLLVGDHTNVFGITTNLNPLASQFGMTFRYDSQYDLDGELSVYKIPRILPHPAVQSMPTFMFATSCTIDAPIVAENAIIGYGIKSMYLDYAQRNFFPKNAGRENMEYGLFVQASGTTYGKGRVFLLADSTPWSNFYMFIPGKPELLLGIMEWLNRKNSFLDILRLLFLILGIIFLFITTFLSYKTIKREGKGPVLYTLLFMGFLITPLALTGIEQLNKNCYPLPKPHTKYINISFEMEHSDFELPVLHMTQQMERSYHTFYVWLQRLGYVPSLKDKFQDALQNSDAVVIINPSKPFSEDEIRSTEEFLNNGGRLLLIDDPKLNKHSNANQLISKFGIHLIPSDLLNTPVKIFRSINDTGLILSSSAGEVNGGNTILFSRMRIPENKKPSGTFNYTLYDTIKSDLKYGALRPNQMNIDKNRRITEAGERKNPQLNIDTTKISPILSFSKVGKGILAVMSSSFLFTDKEMGSTAMIPAANNRRIYDLEYWIFRDVLNMGNK